MRKNSLNIESGSNKYLKEAIRIGEELLMSTEKVKYGLSWKTMVLVGPETITWDKSPYIYDGVSGIALFFLELFRQTKDKKYLQILKDAFAWVEWICNKEKNINNFAFYTGRVGVSYCYLKMYEITNEKIYIEKSLDNIQGIKSYLDNSPVCDLINGVAGSIMGLIHLHRFTGEKWVLKEINRQVEYILSRINHGSVGFYWDRSPQNIRGLCGLAHGSAGIGYVFLELGKYFHNPAYYWVADQAFSYEDYYYDKIINNWPDFRKIMNNQTIYKIYLNAYQKGDLKLFSKVNYMNAWCHGVAGIGLSRLRAYELRNKKNYLNLIMKSIEVKNKYIDNKKTVTLCHGSTGVAETYLQAGLLLKSNKFLYHVKKTADHIILSKKKGEKYLSGYFNINKKEEDSSLFNGNAGIGYFFLRVADSLHTSSILNPKIETSNKDKPLNKIYMDNLTVNLLKRKIISYSFPASISLGEVIYRQELSKFFSKDTSDGNWDHGEFIQLLSKLTKKEKSPLNNSLRDVFTFEKKKFEMQKTIQNDVLYFIQEDVQKDIIKRIEKLSETEFLNLVLRINNSVYLHCINNKSFRYVSRNKIKVSVKPPDHKYFLLKFTFSRVKEIPISKFCYIIFSSFQKPITIREVINNFINDYMDNELMRKKDMKEKIILRTILQVKEGLYTGALTLL